MNRHWSYYDEKTGELSAHQLSGPPSLCPFKNAFPGFVPIEGRYDRFSQRVDLATKQVIDWQPPAPSLEHEWDIASRRWVQHATAAAREARRSAVLAEIQALEATQARAIREAALAYDGAKQRLQALDDQIIKLRAELA